MQNNDMVEQMDIDYDPEVNSRYRYHPHMIYRMQQKDNSHMQSRLPQQLR
jgi:hypothetical protein